MYTKNPYDVPAAGFILVDNLSKLIADNGTYLGQDISEKLFNLSKNEQSQAKEIRMQHKFKMLENKLAEQFNISGKIEDPTNLCNIYMQTESKQIQSTYTRITELIKELLHEERDEMLAYMKREEEISNLEKECEQQQSVPKEKLQSLKRQQSKQLGELQIFLHKVLKYQDIVGNELLINIEKLEHRTKTFEGNAIFWRKTYYDHQRMQRITLFQTKIEQNLENLQNQMEKMMKDSSKIEWKLNTLKSQVIPIIIFACTVWHSSVNLSSILQLRFISLQVIRKLHFPHVK